MKKLYVKYCGGCNATYDRLALVQQLADKLGASIQYDNMDECEYKLLVLGCQRECVSLPQQEDYVTITQNTNIDDIIQRFKK